MGRSVCGSVRSDHQMSLSVIHRCTLSHSVQSSPDALLLDGSLLVRVHQRMHEPHPGLNKVAIRVSSFIDSAVWRRTHIIYSVLLTSTASDCELKTVS